MAEFIKFVLSNFTLTFLVIGFVATMIALLLRPRPWNSAVVVEELLAWFLFFSIGVSFFYNFVMHVFFGEMSARFIGWQQSPFQAEVGTASLGYAVVGFLAFRASLGMRLLAIVGPSCFLLGAAVGHIVQMIETHNFAPGNAGIIFYTDIGLPILGFVLLGLQYRLGRPGKPSKEIPNPTSDSGL
ncbi:hypothetical protein DTL21_09165 [Bremerella cremea]|uniref:DUF4345 domain-containing protein n=1 Tax=Blastopirellula marina TaxID=124 RepID=A0A2S8FV73_9BACT|nr:MULTISPECIES: DUF6790 family protein [Pirellulaceae]PQO36081.1 hypothetical protein C5Y83_09160 [Blastopirellula marina]RCS48758.1 hypothetical protein DTL21_09165 [Bremerella cremea]